MASMKLMPLALAIALLSTPIVASRAMAQVPQIRDVASGSGFTLVVKADGTVVGWGRNTDGQAAQPAMPNGSVNTPTVIDLPGKVLQVAMGELTQYALLEDGTVVAWGQNDEGQLGNGPMGANGERRQFH